MQQKKMFTTPWPQRLLALAFLAGVTLQLASAAPLGDAAVRSRVDALMAKMTPEEKAGQLVQVFYLPPTESLDQRIAAGKIGSVLFVTDPAKLNELQRLAVERSRLKIPLLVGFDVIHGLRTIFPVPIGMAASWDPALAERAQAVAASEARAVGIHWSFAPMVDIARDPRWGRIVEGAGEDPYLGAAFAAAQVRGFQGPAIGSSQHVIAGVKHFVGYGAVLGGRDYDESNLSDHELWNVYLPPFQAAINAGAGNVMSSYNGLNGVPAAANSWLLNGLLRKELGFKGFVVSDASAVWDLTTHGLTRSPRDAAVRALQAGLDMEMELLDRNAFDHLPQALADGEIKQRQLDAAVRRVLEAKVRMGLFEQPYVDEQAAARVLASPAHRQEARIAAERSAVLLRNQGELLPLAPGAITSLAVIGELAGSARDTLGPWVFNHELGETVTIVDGIRTRLGDAVTVRYAPGVRIPKRKYPSMFGAATREPFGDPQQRFDEAVAAARASDVAVMVVGETQDMIGEQASRSSLELSGRQQELIDALVKTGKPLVLLVMSGRPLDLQAASTTVPAIMQIWYPGSQGGAAVANLLFGDASPGGKLPFTWPRNVGQVPLIYAHLNSHAPKDAAKRYANEEGSPLYPFGHGLSYSSFSFSDIKVDRSKVAVGGSVTVSTELRNTGKRTADEVAQLYLHQRDGSAARPVRELKGFQRITLAPGERRTVTFTLGPQELRYWNAASRSWIQDASTFDVWIGASSTASLATSFEVQGKR